MGIKKYIIALSILTGVYIISSYEEKLEIKEVEIQEITKNYDSRVRQLTNENIVLTSEIGVIRDLLSKKLNNYAITFNYYDITEVSNVDVRQLRDVLEGTGLEGLESSFIKAESQYNVNAIFLISLVALESGWGDSDLARIKNNLSGFMAYNRESFDSAFTFDSKEDSILTTAKVIRRDYLNSDGIYHNGVGVEDVNIRYCLTDDGQVNLHWSNLLDEISNEIIEGVLYEN